MKPPEPVHVVKRRREGLLRSLVDGVPYIRFLGVEFDRRGDELTAVLPFNDSLIGNPRLPALHGGATAAFLEIAAMIELAWSTLWDGVEADGALPEGGWTRLRCSSTRTGADRKAPTSARLAAARVLIIIVLRLTMGRRCPGSRYGLPDRGR